MKTPHYSDKTFAPMSAGETATPVSRNKPRYSERTSGANDYPKGAVPKETGWYDTEHAVSRLPGHNTITVCRGRKPGY